jgi:hypothetical protein
MFLSYMAKCKIEMEVSEYMILINFDILGTFQKVLTFLHIFIYSNFYGACKLESYVFINMKISRSENLTFFFLVFRMYHQK